MTERARAQIAQKWIELVQTGLPVCLLSATVGPAKYVPPLPPVLTGHGRYHTAPCASPCVLLALSAAQSVPSALFLHPVDAIHPLCRPHHGYDLSSWIRPLLMDTTSPHGYDLTSSHGVADLQATRPAAQWRSDVPRARRLTRDERARLLGEWLPWALRVGSQVPPVSS